MIFGFDEVTIGLFIAFAFFIVAAYAILRLVFKVALIALVSMSFPIILGYMGFYQNLGINTILVFGILGPLFYITYFFVNKILGMVWPVFGIFGKKEKTSKNKKQQKKQKKEDDEIEISG